MDRLVVFTQAVIDTYLKLNPVWVSAADRIPTEEDVDRGGYVPVFSEASGFDYANGAFVKPHHYWCSIKTLPKPPDQFDQWYSSQPDEVRSLPKETVRTIYNSPKP